MNCDLNDSCFFFNEQTIDMPLTTEYLRDIYCKGCFSECAIYTITKTYGENKVPNHLYPNDIFEVLKFDLFESHGALTCF